VTATAPERSVAAWVRGNRALLGIVGAVLATVSLLTVLAVRSAGRGDDLDPRNPSPNGAQAVARVLAAHGVRVTVVRRAAELERTTIDADTTVMVTSSGHLGRSTAQRLAVRAATAGALVLAAPTTTLIEALRLPFLVDAAEPDRAVEADCVDPLLGDLSVDVAASAGYRSHDADVTTCFPGPGEDPASLVARVDGDTTVYAVGAADLFANDRVQRSDNAAAALRLLGQQDRLVWYVPDARDVVAGDSGPLTTQLPRGLFPAVWLVGAAVLASMAWRGRRLGPLVVEPLPVTVKAVESTQGRGRLYRRVRDRAHAAGILRAATARRLTARLRLPAGTEVDRLAAAVAATTGLDAVAVLDVLADRSVADDSDLTRLAADLAALEREVHTA
jgi:Domain of unknown function (DUF4350)